MHPDITALLAAAENGDTQAMNDLAWYYGGDDTPRDHAKYIYWTKRSAELGNPDGLYNLGVMHIRGDLGRVDVHAANQLWQRAADLGNPPAMANLALSYLKGNGLEANPQTALSWMRKCALCDMPKGMFSVGQFYQFGMGTPVDLVEALAWFLLAQHRFPQAAESADYVARQMTPLQNAQARRRAEDLRLEIVPEK
jgi:hypothetical protein